MLILFFFGLRVWNLAEFPLFIDETLTIQRAEATLRGDPLYFTGQGKALLPWIVAPFISGEAEFFVARYVTLLVILPAIAAAIALARILHNDLAAYVAVILLALNPMLHFHQRLALSDSILSPLLFLFAFSLFMAYSQSIFSVYRFIVSGIIFVGAILAKATALVMLPLPLVAAVLIPVTWSLRERIKALVVIYTTISAIWVPFYIFALGRGVNYLSRAEQGTGGNFLDWQQWVANIQLMSEAFTGYLGILFPLLIIGGVIAIYFRPRAALFFFISGISFSIALILTGNTIFNRYWLASLPAMTVLLAISVVAVSQRILSLSHIVIAGFLIGWVSISLPFILTVNTNPPGATLPRGDVLQYLQADSAGTGLEELSTVLDDMMISSNTSVYGAFAGCDSLQYYLSADVDLNCVSLSGSDRTLMERVNERIDNNSWLILESPGYIEPSMISYSLSVVRTIDRPGGISTITLYRVLAPDNG
jgi:4-amino-4-deoxy-L-arabinose transferase-like glycosyltransferase